MKLYDNLMIFKIENLWIGSVSEENIIDLFEVFDFFEVWWILMLGLGFILDYDYVMLFIWFVCCLE